MPENFRGWRLEVGAPFPAPFFVENNGRSKVLIGPNGCGKSKFIDAMAAPGTSRVYAKLPDVLKRAWVGASSENNRLASPLPQEVAAVVDFIPYVDDDPNRFWSVSSEVDEAVVCLSDERGEDLERGSWTIPVGGAASLCEEWIRPDVGIAVDLQLHAQATFADWLSECLLCLDARIVRSGNPLVGRLADGTGVSFLSIAESFCASVATRTQTRLSAFVGFDLDMLIAPEESFQFRLRMSGEWFPYDRASTAIRRWVSLAATETLREYYLLACGVSKFHEGRLPAAEFLDGTILDQLIPRGPVSGFATKSAWVMLDEPEVHLFGSEAQKLGESLAEVSVGGRLIVATHSLELAAGLVGKCDFFTFTAPGSFEYSPPDEWASTQLARLAVEGPGALAGLKVLYVEGIWDANILDFFYRDKLRDARVVVCPTHGTLAASGVVTSVWQRLIGSPFGVMFDSLTAGDTEERWRLLQSRALVDRRGTVRELRARADRPDRLSNEDLGLLRVQANILEASMETRVSFMMHGLSDIFQVVSPKAFGAETDSWRELGLKPGESFKGFIRTRFGYGLDSGDGARTLFRRLQSREVGVDPEAKQAVDGVVEPFLNWHGV
ncbi:hypothetical protein [Kribbella lupini]|uniref:AbiEii toxin of type IV toxin-antitoxin system n=1 Tax=Kribbella lupini TaxID=291602 RepID=A0ABN2B693_9ACTN